jgi:hypothetical protein
MRGAKQRPLMKKEATPKCKGLKIKTSNEKKRQLQNARGSKQGPSQTRNVEAKSHEGNFIIQKFEASRSLKPASLT